MQVDLTLGPWRPDQPALNNPGVTKAHNVTPTFGNANGAVTYQAMKGASLYSASSMPSRPLGTAIGLDKLNTARVYGGCATALMKIDPASRQWVNISRTVGYSTAAAERWESTEYGDTLLFTNFADPPQWISKNQDDKFADATTLFTARHCATVGDFVVFGNTHDTLDDTVPYRLRWSAIGNPLDYTFSQVTMSDFQDIWGYGAIMGIIGGTDGYVLMRDCIQKMTFRGSPLIFQFDVQQQTLGKGCKVSQSIITVQGVTYYLSDDGFYAFDHTTGSLKAIGAGKVDLWCMNDIDTNQYSYMTVAADPVTKLIYWNYVSKNGSSGKADRQVVYNYEIGEWTEAEATTPFIFHSLSLAWTIEQLATYVTIEAVPASFDDPIWAGGNRLLWGMDDAGAIYTFSGTTLTASIETQEQFLIQYLQQMNPQIQGDRCQVNRVRLYVDGDGADITLRIGTRSFSNKQVQYSLPRKPHLSEEWCFFREQGRYFRTQINLAGSWQTISGLQIDAIPRGLR